MLNKNIDLDDYISLIRSPHRASVPHEVEFPAQIDLERVHYEVSENLRDITYFLRQANKVLGKRE